MELTKRQQAVLREVVERYVSTAQPVASEVIARQAFPGISSATIRHDMATLEAAGLIDHPHTSAGRQPTHRGYRYYVEHLLPARGLSDAERHTILHQFAQVEDAVDEWPRLASATLAATSGVAAIVSAGSSETCRLRHVDLIALDEHRLLLVAITSDAVVHQHILEVAEGPNGVDVHEVGADLSRRWANATVTTLLADGPCAGDLHSPLREAIRAALLALLERQDRRRWTIRSHDGLANLLSQPEFDRPEEAGTRRRRLEHLLAMIEHGEAVRDLLADVAQQRGLRVLIGEERAEPLRDIALVLCPYGGVEGPAGVLGVVGPLRLDYPRAISGTRYVAGILSALLQDRRALSYL